MEVVTAEGYRAYEVGGAAPTEEQSLVEALNELGAELRRMSGPEYWVEDEESGELREAAYYFLALPPTVTAEVTRRVIEAAEWPELVVYPELCCEAGDEEAAAKHERLAERWGLL